MATMNVLDSAGSTVAIEKPLAPGRAAATASRPIVLATEDKAALDAIATATTPAGVNNIGHVGGTDYEHVAASATNQTLGPTGATGDYLSGLTVIPTTTSPGAVSIKDGGNTAIPVFDGGASSISGLIPFFIPIGAKSAAGAWQVTTGTNVRVFAIGDFT